MLSRLWRTPLSAAVIDCHYDAASDTVSACDTKGRIVVVDSDAVPLSHARVDLPAWGIAHVVDESGEPLIAVAEARRADSQRSTSAGALSVIDGTQTVRRRVTTDAPCWDVVIAADVIWCSSWGGETFRIDMNDVASAYVTGFSVGGPAYGLASCAETDRTSLLVCVAERGIGEIDQEQAKLTGISVPAGAAAYNVSSYRDTIVAGSTDKGMVLLQSAGTDGGLQPVSLDGQVSAVAIVAGEFLVAGDLDGGLGLFHLSRLDRPLDGMMLPGGVWNLASDEATDRVYVACGDGHLYALELSLGGGLSRQRLAELRNSVTKRPVSAI